MAEEDIQNQPTNGGEEQPKENTEGLPQSQSELDSIIGKAIDKALKKMTRNGLKRRNRQ